MPTPPERGKITLTRKKKHKQGPFSPPGKKAHECGQTAQYIERRAKWGRKAVVCVGDKK